VWKIVETKVKKIRLAETKKGREKKRKRIKKRKKLKKRRE